MTSLDELLLKWQDRSLSEEELTELNALLAQPGARARLLEEFRFNASLVESLRAAKAQASVREQAEVYETREVRASEVFAEPRGQSWGRVVKFFFAAGRSRRTPVFRWQVALPLAVCFVALATVVFFATDAPNIARLEGGVEGVTILRGDVVISPSATVFLRSGDRIKTTADSSATVVYLKEATTIQLRSGTQLLMEETEDGKRLELLRGTIASEIAPQPPGRPMMLVTPQAEARVVGTEFVLAADAITTRLEVSSGTVRLANREDGKALLVNSGFIGTVGKGMEVAVRSLLPTPWQAQDIGAVGRPGTARMEGRQCKASGSGRTTRRTKDQFHFVYQVIEGDGEIQARVVDIEPIDKHARAGVVIRASLKPDAPHAFLTLRAYNGLAFEHRRHTEGHVDWLGHAPTPSWVRLVRRGDAITAYKSPDGTTWTQTGSQNIKMGQRIYVGLGVSSWNNAALATSAFDNVSVTPVAVAKN